MTKKVSGVFFVLMTLMVGTAAAQDVKAVLQAAAKNMGADNLKTLQITGKGWIAGVGQSYSPADDWPRFEVTTYTRTIDYDAKSSREELTRRQGTYPARGQVIAGEQQLVTLNTGSYGWTMQGTNATAMAPDAAEIRQLEIWLTPHGFLKAAMAPNANPTALRTHIYGDFDDGADVTVVSIMVLGKYRVNGTIAPDNTVQRVQTWIPNPVFGDLVLEHRYDNYKTFGNLKFPSGLHSHLGNPVIHPGHNSQDIQVANIVANGPAPALAIPDEVRKAAVAPVTVESSKLGNGVYQNRRWHASQRGRRVQGLRRRRRSAAERGAVAGGDRGSEEAHSEQADQVHRQHPSPFRPFRRASDIRGPERDDHHAPDQQGFLRERAPVSGGPNAAAGHHVQVLPMGVVQPDAHLRAGRPEVCVERRDANDGDLSRHAARARRQHADRISAGGEDPDQRGPVFAARAGSHAPGDSESEHGEL